MTGREFPVGEGLAPARAARPITVGERVHVVGAAGAGASAAAMLAASAGAVVTACDPGGESPYTGAFVASGIELSPRHDRRHVLASGDPVVDRLAVTKALTAVDPNHSELEAARSLGIPVEAWQQTVADAARSHGGQLIGVAGTHGKSTSAGWLVHVLAAAGRDPGAFVGALMADGGEAPSTARWGRGDVFVVEADEYAGNFDAYRPDVAVILDVEWDHPDVFADEDAVLDVFEEWLRAPGVDQRRHVINVSDPGGARLAECLADLDAAIVAVSDLDATPADVATPRDGPRVGFRLDGDVLRVEGLETIKVASGSAVGLADALEVSLPLAGRHNAANAACVAATAAVVGVPSSAIATGLASFPGVARRMEVKGEPAGVLVIDDYGHHPTAIRATIAAIRQRYPGRRVWAAHEPLTYHRAAAMLDELAAALATADLVVVADIWAGRDPDTTITSAAELAKAVSARMAVSASAPGSVEATADELAERVRSGDIVLAMGGGRSYVIADRLVALLTAGRSE